MRFNNIEEVHEYFSHTTIECLLCGKRLKSLASHLTTIHGVNSDEYRIMFNIPWGRGLSSDATLRKQSVALKKRIDAKDPTLMDIKNVARRGQSAPKRRVRDFELARLKNRSDKISDTRRKATYKKAEQIITIMEIEKLPACYVCHEHKSLGLHNLFAAISKDESLKIRYNNAKKNVQSIIALRSCVTDDQLKQQVISLHNTGSTHREIAETLLISKTSVGRIINRRGQWS